MEATDDRIGISSGHLAQIFSFGFATKEDGYGFGLHLSALAASEMNGSLSAFSDGEGTGATFVLEVPLHREAVCDGAE